MAGSIQKVGNKYRITMETGKDFSGKRKRTYVTATSEAEAKKVLAEFEYNQQRGMLVESSQMIFSEFLDHWMDNYVQYNCEETTVYGYKNILKHMKDHIGQVELQKLQSGHLQEYYKYLMETKKLSPNTVHKHHACAKKSLSYALKQQLVYRNVADGVSLPRRKRFEGQSYTKEQLRELLQLVKGTRLELPIFLAGYMGLRRGEIVGLKWKYVDLDQRVIHIQEVRTSAGKNVIVKAPKTEKSRRTLYIEDELLELLQACKEKQSEFKKVFGEGYHNTGYIYVHENGKPYRVNTVTEQFKDFLEKNNLRRIRFHELRHTFTSILYAEGVDLKAISEALGHSDIGTTNRIYTHVFDKTHKNTISAMSQALRTP
ncbi:site-specific integrase [Paenibacillus sp. FSL K6-2524]|uniref:site-specific integrase n=1 Tax=Paenibacillus sp. FSL K6-2524 TaxID=2954516 RepID=UPI0030F713AC